MNTHPAPKVSRAPAFPLIWVVPLIALAIGGWMGFSELHNRGPEITIDFADGAGVEAGKTVLDYKGVSAGTVEAVELKPGLEGVSIRLRLKKSAASLASTGAQFWIVRPEIGFSGVSGLDTLVSGVHLTVLPGQGPPAEHFTGLDKTPAPDVTDQGRTFILQSDRLGSLTTGAPVFYREFKVGEVEASRLSDDSTTVLIRIHLEAPYVDLVRTSSKFWNTGGFSFKVSLFGGAQLKDTSLESLITGGVAFATPDTGALAPAAPSDAQFTLASEPDPDWLKWSPKIPVKSPALLAQPPAKGGILSEFIKP
ncbi:MAG TPA: MlaD family protein [Opitutaceae bacterium]|jgi:paraquat-inducible protein B|nr:MlaD family protein [Opitutaceae bacterium]